MSDYTVLIILMFVSAFAFVIVQAWFGKDIAAINPIGRGKPGPTG